MDWGYKDRYDVLNNRIKKAEKKKKNVGCP